MLSLLYTFNFIATNILNPDNIFNSKVGSWDRKITLHQIAPTLEISYLVEESNVQTDNYKNKNIYVFIDSVSFSFYELMEDNEIKYVWVD